jgi:hypothetical protein
LLQSINMHTSCSQPLVTGNTFGSLILRGCGQQGGPSASVCDNGRPQAIEMRYEGSDCSASQHQQSPDKAPCSGDPANAPQVQIVAMNKDGKLVWFNGIVSLGETFWIDSKGIGKSTLEADTRIEIYDLAGKSLQSLKAHTSCSQPLNIGDQFGSLELIGFRPKP